MSALTYDLQVLGGTSDVLCTCWCDGNSQWHLIWSSGVLTGTHQIYGEGYTY